MRSPGSCLKTLLADEGKTTGRYDTRFTTFGYPDVQGDNEFFAGEDPSYDAINAAYLDVYMKMLGDIGFKGYANYEVEDFPDAWPDLAAIL